MDKNSAGKPTGLKSGTSREQASLMVFACGFGNIVFTFNWMVSVTGKPFWIAVLIGTLLNIPLGIWIFRLGKGFQGLNVFEIIEKSFGRIICGIVVLLYVSLNLAAIVCMINLFTGSVRVYFLETTPSWFIMLLIVAMCTLFANSGIKTFGWLIELLIVFSVINFFSGFSLSIVKEFKLEHITPIFDTTPSGFAKGVLFAAGGAGEGLLFLMTMVSSVTDPHKHYRWVVKGFAACSLVLALEKLIMLGDVGSGVLSRTGHGGVTISRILYMGQFIRGMEVFILMNYQYIIVTRIVMTLSSCRQAVNAVLHIRKRSWILLLVIALLMFIFSVYMDSSNTAYYLAVFLEFYIILPFVAFVLVVASIAAVIKKRGKKLAEQ